MELESFTDADLDNRTEPEVIESKFKTSDATVEVEALIRDLFGRKRKWKQLN